MADDQGASEQFFRSVAVELAVVDLLATRYLASSDPVAAAQAHREHLRNVFAEVALPGFRSAADSELFVGGVGDAIDRLVEYAGQMAARRVDEKRRSGK